MSPELRELLGTPRFWLAAWMAAVAALVVLGLLSGIIPNPLVVRTLATRPADVAVWLASAPLIGLTLATYVVRPPHAEHPDGGRLRLGIGGAAVYFAIACPVCNKLVLLAIGFSGALNGFAPIQPLIGLASLIFLGLTLAYRLRQIARSCPRCATARS